MDLRQIGTKVEGVYHYGNIECSIWGQVEGRRLTFHYVEPNARGEGWFDLQRPGRIAGKWQPRGVTGWGDWTGERGFEGIWDTSFGLVRLVEEENQVLGFYEGPGSSTIVGTRSGNRLDFRYREPRTQGQGWFELGNPDDAFQGEWLAEGQTQWQPWHGRRLFAMPGVVWLVVIEAHWQPHLLDREYSFGNMLREFFARHPHIHFRHRFFHNEEGLRRWCRDLMYVPEPAVVMIATHATEHGLTAHGEPIKPEAIADSVRYADNIRLLHFSSCLMMQEGGARDMIRALHQLGRFPVSGYTTSVNWAASAILEFTYLEMLFVFGMQPAIAAEKMQKLLTFAGDRHDPEAGFPSAGFRILLPEDASF
jgi:hypothetical protein